MKILESVIMFHIKDGDHYQNPAGSVVMRWKEGRDWLVAAIPMYRNHAKMPDGWLPARIDAGACSGSELIDAIIAVFQERQPWVKKVRSFASHDDILPHLSDIDAELYSEPRWLGPVRKKPDRLPVINSRYYELCDVRPEVEQQYPPYNAVIRSGNQYLLARIDRKPWETGEDSAREDRL